MDDYTLKMIKVIKEITDPINNVHRALNTVHESLNSLGNKIEKLSSRDETKKILGEILEKIKINEIVIEAIKEKLTSATDLEIEKMRMGNQIELAKLNQTFETGRMISLKKLSIIGVLISVLGTGIFLVIQKMVPETKPNDKIEKKTLEGTSKKLKNNEYKDKEFEYEK